MIGIEKTNQTNQIDQSDTAEFVTLIDHDDYEILNVYPFVIRKKCNHYVIKECDRGNGYICVSLNAKTYDKHRLVALQFIPNPLNLPCVDHINQDRTDYHLSNLRWCTASENHRNKSSNKNVEYVFKDEIDEDSIEVTNYNQHEFEDYYYDQVVDRFYFWNGMQFRELYINELNTNGSKYVCMTNKNGKIVKIYYSKFKKLYKLA